jgi:hypothetical protein
MDGICEIGVLCVGRVSSADRFLLVRGGLFVMSASNDPRPRAPLPAYKPTASLGFMIAALVGLALVAVCDLFSLFAGFRLRSLTHGDDGFVAVAQKELSGALSLYEAAGRYQVIVYLPCAIVFIAWFFVMRRNLGLLAPDQFSNGPGWAIGAWLIPVANLWLPYRIALGMWGAATLLPADGERYRARIWPVNLWWALFVLGVLLNRLAGSTYEDAETLTEIRDGVTGYMAADVVHLGAAAAAVYFVVRLSAMHRLKAVQGPYGATGAKDASA